MAIEVNPLHPLFGAEIIGLDLADRGQAPAFEQALGEWGLVLVRRAQLDDAGLARFAAGFGPLFDVSGDPDAPRVVYRVSNLADDGRMKAPDDPARLANDGNRLWHTDNSFTAPGATFSFLHARVVPETGGDTEFLDARIGWEALPADMQGRLAPLSAQHVMSHAWRLVGVDPGRFPAAAPVTRKLVRRHKPSGRDTLVIPAHVEHVEGFGYDASQALLGELLAVAAAPERIYRHRWQVGDLLVWDNRCMLHRATPYRAFEEPRDLRSCRVVDVEDDGLARAC